jgi:hypothetical protein
LQYIELRAGDKGMEGLQPAAALLQKVHTRKHHRYIGESVIGRSSDSSDGGGGGSSGGGGGGSGSSSSQAAKSKEEWQRDCKRACIRWLREELDEVCCDNLTAPVRMFGLNFYGWVLSRACLGKAKHSVFHVES